MTKTDAIEYFGGVRQLAEALETWPQVIYRWPEELPKSRQFELQVKTKGELKVDEQYI